MLLLQLEDAPSIDIALEGIICSKYRDWSSELPLLLYRMFELSSSSRLQRWCDHSTHVTSVVVALRSTVMDMLEMEGWVGSQASTVA